MTYLGIDPGKSGGVVALSCDGTVLSSALTPTLGKEYDEAGMADLIRDARPTLVALEHVHAMPGQGVSSMFSFGAGFGLWRGMLSALGVPYVLVKPRAWQRGLGVPTKATTKERKAAIVAAAKRRWPELEMPRVKDWALADAAWIAEWARVNGREAA